MILNLRMGGARKSAKGYTIIRPVVVGIDLIASWEEADELDRLIQISGR